MVDFSLDRRFDVVISLFSAIAYVRTEERMRAATLSMRRHLNPGGVLLIEPWFTPEAYWTGTITANQVDDKDLKIAWMYTSEREGSLSVLDIHYLVGRPTGIETFQERQELGLFSEEQHLDAFRAAGPGGPLRARGLFGRGLYVAWDTTADPARPARALGGGARRAAARPRAHVGLLPGGAAHVGARDSPVPLRARIRARGLPAGGARLRRPGRRGHPLRLRRPRHERRLPWLRG